MRKFLILILFSFLFSGQITAEDFSWQDLDQTCFEYQGSISSPDQKTIKAQIKTRQNLFFIQEDQILPSKIFNYGDEKFLDYSILNKTSLDEDKIKFLNDNNLGTELEFDPYQNNQREILIDVGKMLQARSFQFQFHFNGAFRVEYLISQDNEKFIKVTNIENFDFRYLKIVFQNYKKDNTKSNLSVQEINFLISSPDIYLLNSHSQEDIKIFASYKCASEVLAQITNQSKKLSSQAKYSIDSETKLYKVELSVNPNYNNDFDEDGVLNIEDNCIFNANPNQDDTDGDLIGDVCDYDNAQKNFYETDSDQDGIGNSLDNCPYIYNPRQLDSNADKQGDLCADDDGDGILGYKDNCINIPNVDQRDININNIGDACEFDKDNDGIFDSVDNCITSPNPDQLDRDQDGIGDVCDNCELYNPRQVDKNQNNIGDVCEVEEKKIIENDKDKDGVLDFRDNCVDVANSDQFDRDQDGAGDLCDNCPDLQNRNQKDENENGVGDLCEDADGDGIDGYLDNCLSISNARQLDQDNDGVGDACEDDDRDTILAFYDNCPFKANRDQSDIDNDGIGDVCDVKDDRFLESNKEFVIGFIVLVAAIFGVLILFMIKKLKK